MTFKKKFALILCLVLSPSLFAAQRHDQALGAAAQNYAQALEALAQVKRHLKEFPNFESEEQADKTDAQKIAVKEVLRLIAFAERLGLTKGEAYARAKVSSKRNSASFGELEKNGIGKRVVNGFSVEENENEYNRHIMVSMHLRYDWAEFEFFCQRSSRFTATLFLFPRGQTTLRVDAGKAVENRFGFWRSGVVREWILTESLNWDLYDSEYSNGVVSFGPSLFAGKPRLSKLPAKSKPGRS